MTLFSSEFHFFFIILLRPLHQSFHYSSIDNDNFGGGFPQKKNSLVENHNVIILTFNNSFSHTVLIVTIRCLVCFVCLFDWLWLMMMIGGSQIIILSLFHDNNGLDAEWWCWGMFFFSKKFTFTYPTAIITTTIIIWW